MERDPRGGEAKKASPGYIPSDSEIDDVLWATHGINPRCQKSARIAKASDSSPVHSPSDSVIDDLLWTTYGINPRRQKSARIAKASDSSPAFSTEGDGGSRSSLILTPGEILGTRLLLAVGVSTSGETISDEQKEVMKGALLRNAETQAKLVIPVYKPLTKDDLQSMSLQELKAAQARSVKRSDNLHVKMEMGMQYKEDRVAMGGGCGGGVGKFSINGVGGVGSGGGVDCSTEKWRDWRYIEDDQEREAAKASSKEAMEKQHAKANDGMNDDLCKRLSKHFTPRSPKPLTKDDILHMPLEEMNPSGAIWSRLSAAQANCKPLTNDDQKHVDPELTVRTCPKCTN